MKVLIFGDGWLGNCFKRYFDGVISSVDITDRALTKEIVEDISPDFVINAAGKAGFRSSFESGEDENALFRSNVFGPVNLSVICKELDVPLVHISTGMLFNHETRIVDELTPVDPQNSYAYSKYIAERCILPFDPLIVRVHLPVDSVHHKRNLISRLINFNDIIDIETSVTVVDSLCSAIKQLVKKNCTGVYNVVNSPPIKYMELLSWYKELVNPSYTFNMVPAKSLIDAGIIPPTSPFFLMSTKKLNDAGITLVDSATAIKDCLRRYQSVM
ncbi:MAG: NAD-dependent epimerase/dehydratase family protein [Nanoarchaeota archaeon]